MANNHNTSEIRPIIPISEDRYRASLARAQRHNARIAAFTDIVPDTPLGTRFYGVESGDSPAYFLDAAGYITPDGYAGGLYSRVKGCGLALVRRLLATHPGPVRIDCLDDGLADMYRSLGFRETGRYPWDDAQAPEYWPYDSRPDYVEMIRD